MYQNEVPLFVRTISQNLRLRALLDIQIVCMYIYICMYLYLYIFLPKLSWCKANPTQWFPPLRIHCCDYCLQQMGDSYVQDPAGAWAY